jgi:hypothetical protein
MVPPQGFKTYLFSYRHDGAEWTLELRLAMLTMLAGA